MPHTCNFYCHGTVHGWTVLVPPGWPEALRAVTFARIVAELGYTLLAFREAPETPMAAAVAQATQGAYVTRAGHVSLCGVEETV